MRIARLSRLGGAGGSGGTGGREEEEQEEEVEEECTNQFLLDNFMVVYLLEHEDKEHHGEHEKGQEE